MKRTWVKVICMAALTTVLAIGMACAANAEKFVFGKHAAEMAAYDAQMKILKAKTAVAVQATKDSYARQDKWMAPVKIVYSPLTAIGFGIQAMRNPSSSPLEYLLFPSLCRGINTAKNHVIQNVGGGVVDMATAPFEKKGTTYAPVGGKIGILGERTMKRGPIANTLETAASATPAACLATGVLAPIAGTSLGGSLAIFGTTVPAASIVIGEGAGMAENVLTK